MADVQNDQRENSLTEAGLHNIEIREDESTYVGRSEAATGDVSQDEAGPEDVSQHDAETQHLDNYEATMKPLIEDRFARPAHWPVGPSNVAISTVSKVIDLSVDIVLLLFASSFLAFALIVNGYDQESTSDHSTATHALIAATKYVRKLAYCDARHGQS
jgi:hypothetical protein